MSSLGSVQLNSLNKPPIIVIHGDAGVGKTTFSAQAPNVIFCAVEDGLGMLPVPFFPIPESAKEVTANIQSLINEQHDYQWLVVDSVTALEKRIWSDLCRDNNCKSIEEVGKGFGKGFTQALEIIDQLVRDLQTLRAKRGMGIILITHSKIQTISPPDKASYDQYTLNLNKKVGEYLHTIADIVAFAELESLVKETDQGFGRVQGAAVETGKRLLHCYSSKKYTSKNRYGIQQPLPMDFNTLMNAVYASAQPTTNQ